MKLPLLAKDTYGSWDNGLNPTMFAAQLSGETVSTHWDMRHYTDEIIIHLDKEYELIQYTSVVDYIDEVDSPEEKARLLAKKKADRDEDDYLPFNDRRAKRLYKTKQGNFLIEQQKEGDNKNKLTWFYPTAQKPDFNEFRKFIVEQKEDSAKVGILMLNSNGSLAIKNISFDSPRFANNDLLLNYGKDFEKIYAKIVDKLSNIPKGLLIFRGASGTGKTTLIKHLTSKINRPFIFIPTGLGGELASPSFLTLLLNHKNSIIVLEDAEQAIQSREIDIGNSSSCSTLLNISEGIISELLKITIILSYNTGNERVDSALTRPGRLNFDYCFKALSIEDGQKLADSLGKNIKISKEMTLAEIYNIEVDTNFSAPVAKKMGFGFGG